MTFCAMHNTFVRVARTRTVMISRCEITALSDIPASNWWYPCTGCWVRHQHLLSLHGCISILWQHTQL